MRSSKNKKFHLIFDDGDDFLDSIDIEASSWEEAKSKGIELGLSLINIIDGNISLDEAKELGMLDDDIRDI